MSDHDAMLAIQGCLDGTEWSSNTLEEIAAILTAAGYRIRDLNDVYREAEIDAFIDRISGHPQ